MNVNGLLHEYVRPAMIDVAAPAYLDLSLGERLTIWLMVQNTTGVTGGEITLLQARDDAGTDEKALVMDNVYESLDAGDNFKRVPILLADSKFTTNAIDDTALVYTIEVHPADLDINNGFTFAKIVLGAMTAATPTAIALHWPKR